MELLKIRGLEKLRLVDLAGIEDKFPHLIKAKEKLEGLLRAELSKPPRLMSYATGLVTVTEFVTTTVSVTVAALLLIIKTYRSFSRDFNCVIEALESNAQIVTANKP